MTNNVFILTIVLMTVSCSNKHDEPNNKTGNETKVDLRTIYQISYHHGGLNKDSVVLTRNNDESEYYDQIQIFRGKDQIFDHSNQDLEIIGTPLNVFTEQSVKTYSEYFYILRLFNGPSPEKFLVIKTTKEETTLFGVTDSNSADIFGDIDFDGIFEIGGWIDYCQESGPNTCPDTDLYRVFEIGDNFPTDSLLTNFFKGLIKKN